MGWDYRYFLLQIWIKAFHNFRTQSIEVIGVHFHAPFNKYYFFGKIWVERILGFENWATCFNIWSSRSHVISLDHTDGCLIQLISSWLWKFSLYISSSLHLWDQVSILRFRNFHSSPINCESLISLYTCKLHNNCTLSIVQKNKRTWIPEEVQPLINI